MHEFMMKCGCVLAPGQRGGDLAVTKVKSPCPHGLSVGDQLTKRKIRELESHSH